LRYLIVFYPSFITFFLFLSYLFLRVNRPIFISLIFITIIIFFCLFCFLNKVIFYCYIISLLILTGLCLVFYYVSCLRGNEYEYFNLKGFFFSVDNFFFDSNLEDLSYLYIKMYGLIRTFLIVYLLFSLLIVVNICKCLFIPLCSVSI